MDISGYAPTSHRGVLTLPVKSESDRGHKYVMLSAYGGAALLDLREMV